MKLDRSWVRSMPLWVIGMGASLAMSVGCQQWSLRESTSGLFGPKAETDDWAPPTEVLYDMEDSVDDAKDKKSKRGPNPWWSNSKNSPSPPRVILPKDRESKKKAAEVAVNTPQKEPSATGEIKSTQSPSPAIVGYGANPNSSPGVSVKAGQSSSASPPTAPADAVIPTPATMPMVTTKPSAESGPLTQGAAIETAASTAPVDTGVRDVDIESALRSLPPEYRDAVRQSIASLQGTGPGKPVSDAASTTPTTPTSPTSSDLSPSGAAVASKPTPALPAETPAPPATASTSPASPSAVALPPALPSSALAASNPSIGADKQDANTARARANAGDASTAVQVRSADYAASGGGSSASPEQPITIRLGGGNSDDSKVVTSSHADRAQLQSTSPGDANGTASRFASSDSNPSIPWRQQTSLAIEALERELANAPPADPSLRVSQELTLRMLYVAQRRLEDALRPIEDLSAREQEFIQHEMKALYDASNPDANPSKARHWSQVMVSQRQAMGHLTAISNLEVQGLAFCDEVSGYGMIERCKKNQFSPDQDVLLYCEIDNVTAERVKAGYETQLQGSYEILDSQKRRITEQLLPMEPELCQNHRRDYYIVYRIFMPQQIQPGRHELALTIEDMKGQKYGRATVDFEIRKP